MLGIFENQAPGLSSKPGLVFSEPKTRVWIKCWKPYLQVKVQS